MADKKEKKKKKANKKYTLYDISNGVKRKNRFCPKCGPGVFLASHSSRLTCGTCGYMEKKEVADKK